jgi:hypothetical protein
VSGGVIRGLEDGANHADISVGLLARLAEALAVDIADLVAADRQMLEGEAPGDSAALGAFLHASETPTPITAVADILGWDNERLEAAIDEHDTNLCTCGLRLHRLNGQLAIARAVDAADRKTVREATRAHLLRAGLSITEARLLRRLAKGGPLKELSNANQVAFGVYRPASWSGVDLSGRRRRRTTTDADENPVVIHE